MHMYIYSQYIFSLLILVLAGVILKESCVFSWHQVLSNFEMTPSNQTISFITLHLPPAPNIPNLINKVTIPAHPNSQPLSSVYI